MDTFGSPTKLKSRRLLLTQKAPWLLTVPCIHCSSFLVNVFFCVFCWNTIMVNSILAIILKTLGLYFSSEVIFDFDTCVLLFIFFQELVRKDHWNTLNMFKKRIIPCKIWRVARFHHVKIAAVFFPPTCNHLRKERMILWSNSCVYDELIDQWIRLMDKIKNKDSTPHFTCHHTGKKKSLLQV